MSARQVPPLVRTPEHAAGHAAGQAARAGGEALALDAAQAWRDWARITIERLAADGSEFTSEDVTDVAGMPRSVGKDRNNAVGAMLSVAARRGVIEWTGKVTSSRRARSHGALLKVWRGAPESAGAPA